MTITWILGGVGLLLMLFSGLKSAAANGTLKTLTKAVTGGKTSKAIPDNPDDRTLLSLEKELGIIPKSGKDEELIKFRIARLQRALGTEEGA